MSLPPDSKVSVCDTGEKAKPPAAAPTSSASKGFKKIFHKIKRSNSGGQLGDPSVAAAAASPSPQPGARQPVAALPEQQHFVRNGLRATAAGRLGRSQRFLHQS